MNKLDQLKKVTTVVADTGDINSIKQYQPQDATTNPSLILKAAQITEYQHLIDDAKKNAPVDKDLTLTLDQVAVNFGVEILREIPGRISTEVDARLSFDTEATVKRAQRIIALYKKQGVERERILIKIAATWEGIQACEQLQAQGINCNLTLMFHFAQALACAKANAFLISPFVGRIYDWYKTNNNRDYAPHEDPGVLSVKAIYNYFRRYDINTIVMGASFRSTSQLEALAGCDYLTIAPNLLQQLQNDNGELQTALSVTAAKAQSIEKQCIDEKRFRWQMNEDAMATEKLAQGIRAFAADTLKLECMLQK